MGTTKSIISRGAGYVILHSKKLDEENPMYCQFGASKMVLAQHNCTGLVKGTPVLCAPAEKSVRNMI